MALSTESKNKINNLIFERANEIENKLSENNFFLAGLAGVRPEQVSEIALKTAIKEIKKTLNN